MKKPLRMVTRVRASSSEDLNQLVFSDSSVLEGEGPFLSPVIVGISKCTRIANWFQEIIT